MEDDGHAWLTADVDFYFTEGNAASERAAERAMKEITRLVEADERLECDEEGFGDGQMGITVTIDLDEAPE